MSRQTKRIFYTVGGGRFGNQFYRHLHFVSVSIRNPRLRFINLGICRYQKYFDVSPDLEHLWYGGWKHVYKSFEYLDRSFVWVFRTEKLVLQKILFRFFKIGLFKKLIYINELQSRDSFNPADIERDLQGQRIGIIGGWKYDAFNLLNEGKFILRTSIKIKDTYGIRSKNLNKVLREKYDRVVGVFIRGTDYRNWRDGKFFFPLETYKIWIAEYQEIYPDLKIGFVIVSDIQEITESTFGPDSYLSPGSKAVDGPFIESFVSLTLVDEIMTPPSTFSATASFLGGVPIILLKEDMQKIVDAKPLHNSFFDLLEDEHGRNALGY